MGPRDLGGRQSPFYGEMGSALRSNSQDRVLPASAIEARTCALVAQPLDRCHLERHGHRRKPSLIGIDTAPPIVFFGLASSGSPLGARVAAHGSIHITHLLIRLAVDMLDAERVTRPTVDTRLLAFVEVYRNPPSANSPPISVSASASVPPRFLFVDNDAGEFLHYRIQLAYAIRRAGFEVHVAVPGGKAVADIAREGFVVHMFDVRRLSMHAGDEIRACLSLFRVYQRVKPCIVHHFCVKPAVYGGLVAPIVGVPAMVTTLTGLGHAFTGRTVSTRMARWVVTRALRVAFTHHNHRLILQNQDDLTTLAVKRVVDEHHAVVSTARASIWPCSGQRQRRPDRRSS